VRSELSVYFLHISSVTVQVFPFFQCVLVSLLLFLLSLYHSVVFVNWWMMESLCNRRFTSWDYDHVHTHTLSVCISVFSVLLFWCVSVCLVLCLKLLISLSHSRVFPVRPLPVCVMWLQGSH